MKFFIHIIGKTLNTGGTPLEKLNAPQIDNITDTANKLSFDVIVDNRATNTFLQYSFNENFENPTTINNIGSSFTLIASELGQPIQNLFIRLRSSANGFVSSDFLVTQTNNTLI